MMKPSKFVAQNRVGYWALATLPFVLAAWLLIRPKQTAASVGGDLFTALDTADAGLVRRYLFADEQAALQLSDHDVERVLKEVIFPGYKQLGVRSKDKVFQRGSDEAYYFAPCGTGQAQAQFTLAMLNREEGVYRTTIFYLYNGLNMADTEIARRTGKEAEARARFLEREAKMKLLIPKGRFDPGDYSIYTWK
jgi:hypothetical protein